MPSERLLYNRRLPSFQQAARAAEAGPTQTKLAQAQAPYSGSSSGLRGSSPPLQRLPLFHRGCKGNVQISAQAVDNLPSGDDDGVT